MTSVATSAAPCRVVVASPTVHWRLTAQLASFLLRLGSGQLADPRRWSFEIAVLPDVQPVAFARNTLVAAFLQSESSCLWFLDDDMTPTDATVAVLDVDADIVTGRAPIVRPGDDGEPLIAHAAFASRKGDAFEYPKAAAHPVPIVAAGAGCLLVDFNLLGPATPDAVLLDLPASGVDGRFFLASLYVNGTSGVAL